jgi:hypothetical protein
MSGRLGQVVLTAHPDASEQVEDKGPFPGRPSGAGYRVDNQLGEGQKLTLLGDSVTVV